MMRQRFCKVCRNWHQLDQWPEACWSEPVAARSDLPMPMVISDSIEPTKSMADGKVYTSKAAIRQTYKPSGNPQGASFVEVGNDTKALVPKPQPSSAGIETALQKAVARYERGERV